MSELKEYLQRFQKAKPAVKLAVPHGSLRMHSGLM
jgi:hypothetical protein